MKKIYFLTLLLSLSLWISAQSFLYEDFSNAVMPPAGWTIDAQAANWSIQSSAKAGGAVPEARLSWSPQFNTTTRLISPVIDMTGYASAKLLFKQFLDNYAGSGYSIGVATRSGGGTWNIVWSVNPTGDIGPEERLVDISNANMGAADFQFCIYFQGNSYNIDYWFIDEIELFVPYPLDAAMSKINTPTYTGEAVPVTGVVRNLGNTNINSMEVSWKVNEDVTYSTTFSGLNLAFSQTYNFTCDDLFHFPIGAYPLEVWISAVNGVQDDNPANDLKNKTVNVYSHSIYRKPCFEEFTSSTCGPCATFNVQFNPWTQNHADDITLVKYQMNWPGSGDPYYTAEAGLRRNYYGVSFVPWPQCNGEFVDYNISAVQAAYNQAILKPGIAKIAASHTLDGTIMTVTANILPFAGFQDFRAHIIVIENTTYGNVATNGETEFHHVMMKMMPDVNGTVLNLNDRETIVVEATANLSDTFIEEFDDLSVVVIFQNFATKEIFQSEYSVENGVFAQEARLSSLTVDGEPVPGFDPDIFEYFIDLPAGTTEIPIVEGVAMDELATVVHVPTWDLIGTTTIDVFGEDLVSHNRYNVHFDFGIGTGDMTGPASAIRVYPNPARDRIYLKGFEKGDISLYTISGQKIIDLKDFSSNFIDISPLSNGVYFMRIVPEDKTIINHKISVVKF